MNKKIKVIVLIVALIASLIATNILNVWYYSPTSYGIALNSIGGIDDEGLFLCSSADC